MLRSCNADSLWRVIDGLHAEATGENHPAVTGRWAELVHTEAERIRDGGPPGVGLNRAWPLVGAEPEYPWTVAKLARRLGISSEHFRRECQRLHGTSPMRYVTALRLRGSISLLTQPALGLAAVAACVGYSSAFAFSHVFKRWFGQSPSIVRERALRGERLPDSVTMV